jgi:putative nucleotidyltransferase with HDIG domain
MTPQANDELIEKARLDDVIAHIQDLPPLPALATDLLKSFDDENADLSVLAQKIAHDQALVAKTLRLANSSFYNAQAKIATVQQAVSLLGLREMRNLVIAAAVSGNFTQGRVQGFDFQAFWRHSIATAVCAKILARHLHLNQDRAFTAGLLHDIGRLVVITQFSQPYEAVILYRSTHDCHLLDAERTVLGIDHCMIGDALAQHWHFPDDIRLAIIGHHEPDAMGSGSSATLIHVADAIVHALDLAEKQDELVPPLSMSAWHSVGLSEEIYLQVFRETELEFEQIHQIL